IVISFILMPFLMWGMQIGVQFLTTSFIGEGGSGEGETIYITNADALAGNVTLSREFTLPFNYSNMPAGTNVTSLQLSDYFIAAVEYETTKPSNETFLSGYVINASLSADAVAELADQGKVDNWVEIGNGFSATWNLTNSTFITLHTLSSGLMGSSLLEAGMMQLLGSEPFTIVDVMKTSFIMTEKIELGEPGETEFSIGAGLVGFFGIMIAVMAPAPFVSTSFAGEREKRTLESLLALPIPRMKILLGKLCAGMVLVSIFAVMNIIGMMIYASFTSSFYSDISAISGTDSIGMSIEVNLVVLVAITISMFLSSFISIGIGIAVASLAKDVRTSESAYTTLLILPTVVVGMIGMFSGVPEEAGMTILYLIPWSHSLAIFTKVLRPGYYGAKSLLGLGLWPDIIFHVLALAVSIGIILFIASKIFDREGIVN
ncbi:MAG: ABC transporter permease, partial [Candidatus Hodarchaeales archaeon]